MIRLVIARLLPYPSFWKFIALQVVSIVLLFYVASNISAATMHGDAAPFAQMFVLPQAWMTACALGRWLFFIPALFTIQIVAAELELKLVRAQTITGQERYHIVAGWAIQSTVLVVVAALTTALTPMLVSLSSSGTAGWDLMKLAKAELGYCLYGVSFLGLAGLCAILLRRPVPALILLTLLPLAIEPLLGMILARNGLSEWKPYLPFAAMDTLVPWPSADTAFAPNSPLTYLSIAYGLLFYVATGLRLHWTDL